MVLGGSDAASLVRQLGATPQGAAALHPSALGQETLGQGAGSRGAFLGISDTRAAGRLLDELD